MRGDGDGARRATHEGHFGLLQAPAEARRTTPVAWLVAGLVDRKDDRAVTQYPIQVATDREQPRIDASGAQCLANVERERERRSEVVRPATVD
jgi:hypothetical protein